MCENLRLHSVDFDDIFIEGSYGASPEAIAQALEKVEF